MIGAELLLQVKSMSAADRIELLGAVWASLAAADAPLTSSEKQLLDGRLADAEQHPDDQSHWRDVHARLERRLR